LWIEKSTTIDIAFVYKIDYMLQRRQIVIKAVGKQIDIEDPVYAKDAIKSFHSITWMLISVIVTIYRTVPPQRYQSSSSHCIKTTAAKIRSRILRIMRIVKTFGSATATTGSGFFVGVLIGYALKEVIKIAAVMVGLFLAGVAYLQYHHQIANNIN
jgi:hypothetical protein